VSHLRWQLLVLFPLLLLLLFMLDRLVAHCGGWLQHQTVSACLPLVSSSFRLHRLHCSTAGASQTADNPSGEHASLLDTLTCAHQACRPGNDRSRCRHHSRVVANTAFEPHPFHSRVTRPQPTPPSCNMPCMASSVGWHPECIIIVI